MEKEVLEVLVWEKGNPRIEESLEMATLVEVAVE